MIRNRLTRALQFATAVTLLGGGSNFLSTNALLGWESRLYAQTSAYPYRRYDDRKEGLIRPRQLVAGEKLVLLAAVIENSEPAPNPSTADYNLGFYLKDSKRVDIVVREFKKVKPLEYKMEPLQKDYAAGLRRFSWPSEIPRGCGLAISDLFPKAVISGTDDEQIVPLVLFHAAPQSTELAYRFCFTALQNVSVLQYKIYRADPSELVYAGTLRDLEANQEIYLRWNGKDQSNRPTQDGLYKLVIEATFRPLPGENPKKVTTVHEFYHYAEILRSNWTTRK